MRYDYDNRCTVVTLEDLRKTKQQKLVREKMTPYDIEMYMIQFDVREKIKREAVKNSFPCFFEFKNKRTLLIAV